MTSKNISKSRFLAGLQCEKHLWLELYRQNLKDAISESTEARFEQGNIVGGYARFLYPDGVLIEDDYLHTVQAIQSTEKAVASGVNDLYEATAKTDRFTARADILHRVKKNGNEWDMIEVKSTLDPKDEHLLDLTFQKYVFEGAGYKIRKTYICHLNRDYVRRGPINVQDLFNLSDQTASVNQLLKDLPLTLKRLTKAANAEKEPNIPIGPYCYDPHECPFIGHCWKDVPEKSVFSLTGKKAFVWDLYKKGIKKLVDIPNTTKLTVYQRKQIEAERTGKTYWKIPAIQSFLESLEYPLSFLDFESFALAIPPYDDMTPLTYIPCQFSLHIIKKPGDEIQHLEFLGDGIHDPRIEFSEALVKALPPKGSILIYSPYEKRILRETAHFLPKFKTPFNNIIERCQDLAVPFQKRDVVHPGFEGRYSIKNVLPALVPSMSYDDLAIGEGGAAVDAYLQLMDPNVSETAKKQIRKHLLEYCGQDTMAMVRLVEVLMEKVN